jgi:hypothetical protein
VSAHAIGNQVPTPEEMGEILGLSSDRVASVRRIMETPSRRKASGRSGTTFRAGARKKSPRASARAAAKR